MKRRHPPTRAEVEARMAEIGVPPPGPLELTSRLARQAQLQAREHWRRQRSLQLHDVREALGDLDVALITLEQSVDATPAVTAERLAAVSRHVDQLDRAWGEVVERLTAGSVEKQRSEVTAVGSGSPHAN